MASLGIAIFLAALAATGQDVQEDSMTQTTLRVLTFNIKHGSTMNGDFDLDRIAGVIRDVNPDLAALQEVDAGTGRAKRLDLVAELARRTGLTGVFGPAMEFDGGEYGVAVLSRHPLGAVRREALPSPGKHEPRTALAVEVRLPDGKPLRFVSTHLEVASEADRLAQAGALNEVFGADDTPTVLAGDFNATPGSATMALLAGRWTIACGDNARPTYPSDAPRIKIDYVLYRPASAWQVLETRVIADSVASDHCPYLVVLGTP